MIFWQITMSKKSLNLNAPIIFWGLKNGGLQPVSFTEFKIDPNRLHEYKAKFLKLFMKEEIPSSKLPFFAGIELNAEELKNIDHLINTPELDRQLIAASRQFMEALNNFDKKT